MQLHEDGVDVVVLEAADRVGGRTLTEQLPDGTVIDHGGQWVGPTQTSLLAMAERFGASTFSTFNAGDHVEVWADGTKRTYRAGGPEDGPGMAAYDAAVEAIDELARTIHLDDPAATPRAAEWDAETCHSFFERTVPDADARARLALAVQGVWTVEPRDLSVLHFLFYIQAAGGFEQLMETEGCAQDSRFTFGTQDLAKRMATALSGRLHLEARVTEIDQSGSHVRVSTSRGIVEAERVIVAVPPPAALRIQAVPALPLARRRWLGKSQMGDVAKVHVGFKSPFWRQEGLSGEATTYGDRAVGVIFDNSPSSGEQGILVCFVYADRLHEWAVKPEAHRRADVLDVLTEIFGAAAGQPTFYTEKIWSDDPFVHGGYAASPTPGAWLEHSARGWRMPTGRLHWAGTETSSVWNGYIEGAIRSGVRAAAEVEAALGRTASLPL